MSANSGLLGGLGAACYRHRWLTMLAWIAGVACLITLWMRFGAPAQNSFAVNDPGQSLPLSPVRAAACSPPGEQ